MLAVVVFLGRLWRDAGPLDALFAAAVVYLALSTTGLLIRGILIRLVDDRASSKSGVEQPAPSPAEAPPTPPPTLDNPLAAFDLGVRG